ncbi:kinase-associated protein B [Oikeobacillus pervagus]|uniref:Kinase-associated protein B n=1 Tax=Oikeobacillus pervagus TaxID=1325931 RepID=A0AAJ1WKR7_9BACI|nr:kinase-associated lipoprotein B [Oikeobacillus pervagus]MDQ0216813.1 kinase-associated protein B [Oikeobacillus pervagus]
MNIGEHVIAFYKTGKYIGEIIDKKSEHYVVQILAVEKHPIQGDLHHPKTVDVPFFHERKALAFRERANIPSKMVKPYDGEIPVYTDSLKKAFHHLKEELQKEQNEYQVKSLQSLQSIQKEYELLYSIEF